MRVCLDSWAILEWLKGIQPAAQRVESALDERPIMSWINLGEVYYVVRRAKTAEAANLAVQVVAARAEVEEPRRPRILAAAAIKAQHALAYADAFAIATANAHAAVLWTGDPEIIGARGGWAIEDLRGQGPHGLKRAHPARVRGRASG